MVCARALFVESFGVEKYIEGPQVLSGLRTLRGRVVRFGQLRQLAKLFEARLKSRGVIHSRANGASEFDSGSVKVR